MNGGRSRVSGYTIVETMIFLAVSGAMVIAVMALVASQQRRTEFQTAVREFQNDMQDVANDVSTGFFNVIPDTTKRCQVAGNSIQFNNGGNGQAANRGECVLIGKVVRFTDTDEYNIYTMAGRKKNISDEDVKSFAEATPMALNGNRNSPDTKETRYIRSARIARVSYNEGTADIPRGAIGFFTSFATTDARGLASGSSRVTVVPVNNTSLNADEGPTISAIEDPLNLAPPNPSGGIKICLESETTEQYAIVGLGVNKTGLLTVSAEILEGPTCP